MEFSFIDMSYIKEKHFSSCKLFAIVKFNLKLVNVKKYNGYIVVI